LRARLLRARRFAQATQEQGFVDSALEDRDAQLDALGDYVFSLETRLSRKLGGRQMVGHRSSFAGDYMPKVLRLAPTVSILCSSFVRRERN
jgi:hypothetical protein